MKELNFIISGMTCMHCVNTVKNTFKNFKGVKKAEVTLNPPEAIISCKENINAEELIEHLENSTHYRATLK